MNGRELDRLMTNDLDLPERPKRPTVEEHRREMFSSLGFTDRQVDVLVDSKDHKGVLVHWSEAKSLLDSGASTEMVFDILSEPTDLHG